MTNENVKKMKPYRTRINVRLSSGERAAAEQLVRERKFKNLSQVIRTALQELLAKQKENLL